MSTAGLFVSINLFSLTSNCTLGSYWSISLPTLLGTWWSMNKKLFSGSLFVNCQISTQRSVSFFGQHPRTK